MMYEPRINQTFLYKSSLYLINIAKLRTKYELLI